MINYTGLNNTGKLSFSCRLMAFYSSKPEKPLDKGLVTEFLVNAPISLKNQSSEKTNSAISDARNREYNHEDLIRHPDGNPHGWGILTYNKDIAIKQRKSQKTAYTDKNFDKTVNELLKDNPNILLAHVRWASIGCRKPGLEFKNNENNHPFVHENWSLMENGYKSHALSEEIQTKIADYSEKYDFERKGTTDSENVLYYFLGKLKDNYPEKEFNCKSIGVENVKNVLVEAISELISKSSDPEEQDAPFGGLKVKYNSVRCNTVISDGEVVMAYKKGNNLYLGMYEKQDGERNYVLSSEKIKSDNFKMKWWFNIPDNSVVVLEPDKDAAIHWLK